MFARTDVSEHSGPTAHCESPLIGAGLGSRTVYNSRYKTEGTTAFVANIPVSHGKESAGDPLPPKCALIEVRVAELKQLFNSIDPSPFRNKDLDPRAEEFIIGWAKDLPKDAPLGLVVDLDRPAGLPDEAAVLRDAVHEFFSQRAHAYRRRLRELFRLGRTSLKSLAWSFWQLPCPRRFSQLSAEK